MEQIKLSSADYISALRFISLSVNIYDATHGKLNESVVNEQSLVFFSRSYLRERQWTVFPLWEGDLRVLQFENGRRVEFLKNIASRSLQRGDKYLYVVAMDGADWPYAEDFSAVTVAVRKIDLQKDDPSNLFETTPTNMPHWGNNFFWMDNQRFMIYTDGDNAAFIAGDRKEIETILNVSYAYCRERFVSSNVAHQTQPNLIDAYIGFCDEFAYMY